MSEKFYDAKNGVAIDDCFANHFHNCAQCRKFDAEKPATVVSKEEARKAMRYK